MGEKRARKAAEEAKENKANELLRRKAGQASANNRITDSTLSNFCSVFQDQTAAKEELKAKQMKKEQEAKARGNVSRPVLA